MAVTAYQNQLVYRNFSAFLSFWIQILDHQVEDRKEPFRERFSRSEWSITGLWGVLSQSFSFQSKKIDLANPDWMHSPWYLRMERRIFCCIIYCFNSNASFLEPFFGTLTVFSGINERSLPDEQQPAGLRSNDAATEILSGLLSNYSRSIESSVSDQTARYKSHKLVS